MTAGDFDALFDQFTSTVTRLEALPAYAVGGAEEQRIQAWRDGLPRPERSVHTSPWLARIAVTSVTDGKSWTRVRVVDEPLTEYQRYQLQSYVEGQAAGEQIRIAVRTSTADTGPDFWLFDQGTDGAYAAVMNYDEVGHWLGFDVVDEPSLLLEMAGRLEAVDKHTVPLNEYLAGARRG